MSPAAFFCCEESFRSVSPRRLKQGRGPAELQRGGLPGFAGLRRGSFLFDSKRKLAERGGFEPPVGGKAYNGLANRPFRPLRHLSVAASPAKKRAPEAQGGFLAFSAISSRWREKRHVIPASRDFHCRPDRWSGGTDSVVKDAPENGEFVGQRACSRSVKPREQAR